MNMRFDMRVRSGSRWLGRGTLVAAGLFAAHAAPTGDSPAGPASAWAQQASVSGRLTSIWEDPIPQRGTPRLRHFLSRSDGEMVALRVTDSQLRVVGGAEGANGQYVEVDGSWRAPQRTPGGSANRELEVSSIHYSIDPLGASPPAQGAPITGSHPWITVLCRFSDLPIFEPHPLSWYQQLMGGSEPGVDHYWRELSYDQANVAGSGALGWYDLPQPHSYYVNDSTGVSNLQLLKEDCAAVADADIHYPDFVGINFQFNEDLAGFSWGGSSNLFIDGVIQNYRMTWMSDWADHVTYTHEMGHGFGLPHSSGPYGAVYDSNWDVMSGAWTNHDPSWGWLAPHTISWHKDMLGWIPADRIYDATVGLGQTIKLHRLADLGFGGDYLMARIPRPDGTFYTVEARQFEGYDVNLPAEAVIMHHVTSRAFVVDSDDPADNTNPDDDGARWLPGETFSDTASGITVTVDSATGDAFTITIALLGPPHIVLEPASLSFDAWQGTDPVPQTLVIRNSGTEELLWTISDDAEWLELGEASGTAAGSESSAISVTVLMGGLAPGTYAATITVSGNADNSPRTADVEFVIAARPELDAQEVADQLMGLSTTLTASELEYLDDIGNQNGGFDVGDFRAWLQMEGLMSRVRRAAGEEVAP
jgi:M6 family metalloprotease-like protein